MRTHYSTGDQARQRLIPGWAGRPASELRAQAVDKTSYTIWPSESSVARIGYTRAGILIVVSPASFCSIVGLTLARGANHAGE